MGRKTSSKSGKQSTLNKMLEAKQQLDDALLNYTKEDQDVASEIQLLEIRLKEARQRRSRALENVKTTQSSVKQIDSVIESLRSAQAPVKKLPAEVLLRIFCERSSSIENSLTETFGRWKTPTPGLGLDVVTRLPLYLDMVKVKSDIMAKRISHWAGVGNQSQQHLMLLDRQHHRHVALEKLFIRSKSKLWKAVSIMLEQTTGGAWDTERIRAEDVKIYRTGPSSLQFFVPLMRYATQLTIFGTPNFVQLDGAPLAPISFNGRSFIDLLHALPQLTNLVLDFYIDASILEKDEIQSITHSGLESLSYHLRHCVANGHLFGVELDAPSLQETTILSVKCKAAKIDGFFRCMWETPTRLVLPALDDYEVVDVAELVRWYPQVDTLEVKGANIDTLFIFFHTLFHQVPPKSEPLPLPFLLSLFLTNTDLRGETLIELLESRLRHVQEQTPGVRAMTHITIYDTPGVTPSHWIKVQQLLEEGRRTTGMTIAPGNEQAS